MVSIIDATLFYSKEKIMEENKVTDPFTAYEEVLCRDGVKRRVYPAKLKYKDLIRKLTPKFNDVYILENVFADGANDKEINEAWDAMMDLLVLAFDEKYTKDEINEWLDFNNVPQVFEIFYGLSSLKKKQMMMNQ